MPSAFPTAVLRNGSSYNWAGLRVSIAGVELPGLRAIEYDEDQTMEPIYGVGNKPIGVGYGNISYSGKLTLLADDLQALQEAAPNGRLQEIPPFTIPVVFRSGFKVMTDQLLYVKFVNNARAVNQGDSSIPVELNLFIGSINWHAG